MLLVETLMYSKKTLPPYPTDKDDNFVDDNDECIAVKREEKK